MNLTITSVGGAEALAYDMVEAQADPLDPTTKYFLNRWIDDYYSRRGATVETSWPRSLRFLTTTLANEAFRLEGNNVAMLAAGAARDELQVERVTLRIHANPDPPHGAAADFDLVRLVNGAEVGCDRWTVLSTCRTRAGSSAKIRTWAAAHEAHVTTFHSANARVRSAR